MSTGFDLDFSVSEEPLDESELSEGVDASEDVSEASDTDPEIVSAPVKRAAKTAPSPVVQASATERGVEFAQRILGLPHTKRMQILLDIADTVVRNVRTAEPGEPLQIARRRHASFQEGLLAQDSVEEYGIAECTCALTYLVFLQAEKDLQDPEFFQGAWGRPGPTHVTAS